MLKTFLKRMSRTAEFIAAMMLAAIFITFLLQIFSRYAPKIAWLMPIAPIADWMMTLEPIGWTINLISLLWVWLIFFGCSFFVKDKDHVAFDILYQAAPPKIKKIMVVIGSSLIIGATVYAFFPTWEAIFDNRLMTLKKIQTLRMPITGDKIAIKWLFAPYIMLMIAVVVHYGWRIIDVLRGASPEALYDESQRGDE